MVENNEIIRRYCAGDNILDIINLTVPPLTTYSFYKILRENNIELRGVVSKRKVVPDDTILVCQCCSKSKPAHEFSRHTGTRNGFDTYRCKACKSAKVKWSNVSLQKRIFHRIKSRATRKGLEFNLELSDIKLPEKCPVYNHAFIYNDTEWTYSVDRIDNSKGYTRENIQIISNKANRLKNNATIEEITILLKWMLLNAPPNQSEL